MGLGPTLGYTFAVESPVRGILNNLVCRVYVRRGADRNHIIVIAGPSIELLCHSQTFP
jgi:hypothetical protein